MNAHDRTSSTVWAGLVPFSVKPGDFPDIDNPRAFLVDDGPDAGMIVVEVGHVDMLPTIDGETGERIAP